MSTNIEPITLEGKVARLEPLGEQHVSDPWLACEPDPALWAYMPVVAPQSQADMARLIELALQAQAEGKRQPFAIIDLTTEHAVGSTSFLDFTPHRGVEIGWTWLGPQARRTGINTECKYMLLRHAFETYGAIRVQLKTDSRNQRSQNAIARLGATREGVLRNHVIMPDGYYRASAYFSVLDSEWPQVKAHVQSLMKRE